MSTVTHPRPGSGAATPPPPVPTPSPSPAPAAAARLLARVRAQWRVAVLVRALVAALAVAACVAAALILVDLATDLPADVRRILGWAPLVGALVPVVVAAVRLLRPPTDERLALLAEERVPGLRNAFVTAITTRPAGDVGRLFTARLDRSLAGAVGPAAPRWLVAPRLRRPAIALAVGAVALLLPALLAGGPAALLETWRRPAHETPLAVSPGSPLERALSGASADVVRLGALRWSSIPPGYASLEPTEPSGEEPIRALAGSGIVVRFVAAGPEAEWSVRLIGAEDAPIRLESGLEASFTLAAGMRALELVGRREDAVVARRVVPLAAIPDEAPTVLLEEPWRDEVLSAGAGTLTVRARATDDHGVADVRLGWIRSRGSGESFAFEEGESAFDQVEEDDDGAVVGESGLDLGALDLRPGDVLHLRALARDENDVTGPGLGVSPTRVIRIAAEGETHEVTALIGAPPDVEERPVLSQRMIILMTERLRDEAPGMDGVGIAMEAGRIAREQGRLRARIGEILFARSTGGLDTPDELPDPFTGEYAAHGHADHEHVEGDELWDASDPEAVLEAASRATGSGTIQELSHVHDDSPVIAVNRELLSAYNAMYDAERALRQAAPDSALPPEYRALDILQSIREGERVFVRGQVTVPPVDVAAARGTGELTDLALGERSAAPAAAALSAGAALDEADAALGLPPQTAALTVSTVAARLLSAGAIDADAAALLSRAATAAAEGRRDDAAGHIAAARTRLEPVTRTGTGAATPRSRERLGAAYHQYLLRPPGAGGGAEGGTGAASGAAESSESAPFVFATARYGSGDWDSAPLVATNLTHSLAQYTGIEVEPEPVVVDLASDQVFEYPFLFLTGHLPVRFTEVESRNLRAFVERGGFVFIDDHNHDIDAAFHRTATAELTRIFGADALAPLPNDHELYSAFFLFDDGPPTTTHELNGWGDGLIHEQLQAIMVDGRIGVLYSNKDYASEWNYHAVNKRFQALDNTRFGVNVLIYALTR